MAAWSNLQGAPRKAEILWEVYMIWQDIMWCQQCTSTWVQFRHQVPGQHSDPYTHFKQIQCYQYPIRNFKNATVKYGLIQQVHSVRSPCAMWYAVWQMCTDVLWDDPLWCYVMQYGGCVQMVCEMTYCDVISCSMAGVQMFCEMTHCDVVMSCSMADVYTFCEMTHCDVMSCSMADVYRWSVRWPIVMWCHAVWQMCTRFVRWPIVMWCHAVWQMCTDGLWVDPLSCDVMQCGRCVHMFCEMTHCHVMSCSVADVYRWSVRTCCRV
jgi:hypothetical protein